MGCEPDEWAKEWLAKRRSDDPESVKGWTIEKRSGSHYIKWGTTYWDKEQKKYRKRSKMIGTLNPNGTITYSKPHSDKVEIPSDIKDYGNALLLDMASERIVDSLEANFPDTWRELLAMAQLRLLHSARLNHLSDSWRLLDDIRGLRPRMSPEILSKVLEVTGGSFVATNDFYESVDDGDGHFATDLSVIFSRSKGATLLRKGYNRFRLQGTQFNIAVMHDMTTKRPVRMSTVAGNVKENSVIGMIHEFDIGKGTVLVMDRGYCGKNILSEITDNGYHFIVAAKRNSKAYDVTDVGDGHFTWNGRAIDYGVGRFWGYFAYRFEDVSLRGEEIYDKYRAEEEKGREVTDMDRAGHIMLLSSLNIAPKEVYRMFKCRCSIENFFDTGKNDLAGNTTYLRTDLHIMGYNFVTFLSFCIWSEIRSWLETNDLDNRFTPYDLLRKFAAVKVCYTRKGPIVPSIPRDVRDLATKLGITIHTPNIES